MAVYVIVDIDVQDPACGTFVGTALPVIFHQPSMPWPYVPLVFVVACAVALPFAIIGAVVASLVLIGLKKRWPDGPLAGWIIFGAFAGALIGAVHPIR